jgi:endonuclease/exonuclease/phosphatase family metal-dependent hydrolase
LTAAANQTRTKEIQGADRPASRRLSRKFKPKVAPMTLRPSLVSLLVALFATGAWGAGAQAVPAKTTSLSVMTYNVHGLPWPLAFGRDAAFAKIEARLLLLRRTGAQPHVIVFQEAFTQSAKQIAAHSGYRYTANGPSRDLVSRWPSTLEDRAFAAAAHFFKGETLGKLVDSGLQVASDYPILSVRRAAFPAFACAGYDCLANKGIMLVTVDVPGSQTPVTIATTHLNSKKSSGVSQQRSLYAYRRQVEAIDRFISANRNPQLPIVFAGDFNASNRQRRSYLVGHGEMKWTTQAARPVQSALQRCLLPSAPCGAAPSIANEVVKRGRDWQFYTPGIRTSLDAVSLTIPFGRERDGAMLSDHVGYGIVYRLQHRVAANPHAI